MSTYNGEKFLDKQMQSIVSQKDVDDIKIRILVRDDGSTDGTIDILNKWKKRIDISIIKGENIGARNSFFVLLNSAPKSDYYAFCDQDDIWNYDKIAKSLNCIIKDKTLYFSNVEYIDKNDYSLKKNLLSKDFALSLERLFMCNPANGCTMVWDDGIQEVLKKVNNSSFTMHDEFVCMVAFVAGNVVYDEIPSMKYRIHGENVTQQRSLRKKYENIKDVE